MDEYVLHQSHLAGDLPSFGILSRLYANWQARKATSQLLILNNHILRDMGLSRSDVEWAVDLPLSRNAITALQECTKDHW